MSSDHAPLVNMDLDEEAETKTEEPQALNKRATMSKTLIVGALFGSLLLAGVAYNYGKSSGLRAAKADTSAIIMKAEKEGDEGYGKADCPCIGIDGMSGTKEVEGGGKFPADLGAHCHDWDNEKGKEGAWRKETWCYVDPCHCKLHVPPKQQTYMPDARYRNEKVYYSYNTCGGTDLWTPKHNPEACPLQKDKDACKKDKKGCAWNDEDDACVGAEYAGQCTKDVPEEKYGKKGCRCAGIEHQKGEVKFETKGKKMEYPVDLGSTCEDWDAESSNPACQGDSPADWCKKKWCYVDPCECELDAGPFVATYGGGKWSNSGNPTYYSYVTCGGKNTFADDAPKFKKPESCGK